MSNDAFEHKNVIRKNAVVIKSTFSWSMRSVALAFILIQNWCHKHNVDMPVAAAVIVRVPINLNKFQCLLLNHLSPVIVLVLDMGSPICGIYLAAFASLHHYDDVTMSLMASQITSLTIFYSTFYSGAGQRKHQSSTSLAFVYMKSSHKFA